MREVTNKFGEGILYGRDDLGLSIYTACTACMSVWSDFLSYINSSDDSEKEFTSYVGDKTDTIVVLGCQVTDLAIYNDLKTAEELHNKYPDLSIYMGGCLAYRFDIELPNYIRRLEVIREEYQPINDFSSIDYKNPFWNRTLADDADEFETGNLFRHSYPLKIGAGCHGKCKYCTIRDTRGNSYETDAFLQVKEFLDHDEVVLISDSPTVAQIRDWIEIAARYEKPISFRNVEPYVAMFCSVGLKWLAIQGFLKTLHCPIQSNDPKVLRAMNRDVETTLEFIDLAQDLRDKGVKVATNIIIDYPVDGEVIHNMPEKWLNEHFDYWSWNPYFDGKWNYDKAKERFEKYIGEEW